MFEAIGARQYGTYFAPASTACSTPGGLACVQTIAMPDQRFARYRRRRDWIQEYVFPGSLLPSLEAIADSASRALAAAGPRGRGHRDRLRARPARWRARSGRLEEVARARLRRALRADLGVLPLLLRSQLRDRSFRNIQIVLRCSGERRLPGLSLRASELLSYETYRRRADSAGSRPPTASRCAGQENVPPAGRLVVAGEPRLDARSVHPRGGDPTADPVPRQVGALEGSGACAGWLGSVEAIPVHRGSSDIAAIRSAIEGRSRTTRWSASSPRAASIVKVPGSAARPGWRSQPEHRFCPCGCSTRGRHSGPGTIAFPTLAALIGEPIAVAAARSRRPSLRVS